MDKITEIQIIPIKPQDGLVAFASLVFGKHFYLGSIGIHTRLEGGYRLVYPTKKVGMRSINIFHPINKDTANEIHNAVIKKYQEILSHD